MKLKTKLLFLGLFAFSLALEAKTKVEKTAGDRVYGYYPYYNSIGSQVIESSSNKDGVNLISVGAKIQVPSHLYEYKKEGIPQYRFVDKDSDIATALGLKNPSSVPSYVTPVKTTQVKWFIIKAAPGYRFEDEPDNGEKIIKLWTPEQVEIITEITDQQYVDYIGDNGNSRALIVPEYAVGYRIGFWALPETEIGIPDAGNWVKVFDLGQLFTQNEPLDAGPGENVNKDKPTNPDPDPLCLLENCGTPNGENPGGGGGLVPGENWIINIYDGTTNNILSSEDKLKVNHTYYATIRIKNTNREDGSLVAYRDPKPNELETLRWNIFDIEDANNTPIDFYDVTTAPARVINGVNTVTLGTEVYKKYEFKTQVTNDDAATGLKALPPNFSEQGLGLGISIEIDEDFTN